MKAIWKGNLKISLVTIPVKMYTATSRKSKPSFNQLHAECKSRIRQQLYCPQCERVVARDELVKGYEYGKDMFVVVTDEDFEKAQQESTDAIEIMKFVDREQIDPIYYADSHYLAPDGKMGLEAFALFHQGMITTNKSAMAKVVIRNKEHLISIQPHNGLLAMYNLHYQDEIQDVSRIDESEQLSKLKPDKDGLDMTKTLIGNLSGEFRPEDYVDEYSKVLMEIIKAKVEGEEIEIAPKEEKHKVINLMEALEQSVKKTEETPKKKMSTAGKRAQRKEKKRKNA